MRAPETSIKNKSPELWIQYVASSTRGAKEADMALSKILKQLGLGYEH